MSRSSPLLRLLLLAVACFALATVLQRRALTWSDRAQADNVLKVLFGDGRRLFASHFFTQADISFHSGYYPSIFDQARNNQKKTAMAVARQTPTRIVR